MRKWEITYTQDKTTFLEVLVVAATYTKALVEFLLTHPDCEYTEVKEIL